ncbi:hypothetical protein [Microbacterium sp. No. 7]|uniref:hypothetical protein n=1 Tax=Microbacterium sp. No. 7 TaxID=1714373 RepID=UPI0006D03B8B|nr:hypothetical protein [Microbacterium sp. No. 7]ALJ20587.1 hypothetical protein AOA12_12010 [Microbacterium sp. No. 7]ALJ22407.1 hypothetical protein AOA12_22475 [Microbacterium sp. No. 7]
MREISIAGRTITVSHVKTTHSDYGDIQRYLAEVSDSDATTYLTILRSSSTVDARVVGSVVDTELLRGHDGSADSGLLRDPAIRAWRDENRHSIDTAMQTLADEIAGLPPEPVTDIERTLLSAFGIDAGAEESPRA